MRRELMQAFGRPVGVYGAIAAAVMAVENRVANRAVIDALEIEPGEVVLEVGCGPGMAARHAARAIGVAGAVTGIDPAPVMIRAARLAGSLDRAPGVRWSVAGVESLPFDDASFSTVLAVNSFHHWSDRSAGMAELGRVVRSGGRIVLVQRLPSSRHPGARHMGSDSVDTARAALAGFGLVAEREVRGGRDVLAVLPVRPG